MNVINPCRFLIAAFLVMLVSVPLFQMFVEIRRGEWPHVFELVTRRPTQVNLRYVERRLEAESATARVLRPWMQACQFFIFSDAGEKAILGCDSWLFYQPGLSFLTQRRKSSDATPKQALAAILDFRDQLASRGVHLVLVPAPNKESIYPDKLTRRTAAPARIIGSETREFVSQCKESGLDVVDLFALFRNARKETDTALYLTQDSHWAPTGMKLAAEAVAAHILTRGWVARGDVAFDVRPVALHRYGDLVNMLRSPPIEALLAPECLTAEQVMHRADATPYADDPSSPVLVLGDSFLRIYEQDEPGQAGFIAHLARELGRPLASIANDGGASTLVRQELCRRPRLLEGKKVIVWEFVERDLRLGTEGWQPVPLPLGTRP